LEVSFHVGFIQEVAGFGVELAFGGYLPQKHHPSAVDDAREDARRARDGCVLWAAKQTISYIIPTWILSFHTIEYFVPF